MAALHAVFNLWRHTASGDGALRRITPAPSITSSDGPMPDTSPRPAPVEHRFPCAACGADYRYDPGAHHLICDHCGDIAEIETGGPWQGGIRELDFAAAIRDQLPAQEMEETRVTTCTSCGAQVELGRDTHATECPFCASPVVTGTGTHRHIKPRALLPFALDEGRRARP